jgi:hypothetical protein
MDTTPPVPVFPEPTVIKMAPPLPPADVPEPKTKLPELPDVAKPELKLSSPDTPPTPASGVFTMMSPLDVATPVPDCNVNTPPAPAADD